MRKTPIVATFSATPVAATLAVHGATAAEDRTRTITGPICNFHEAGLASTGLTRFAKGSLRLPADLSGVKLLTQHDTKQVALGYMVSYNETDTEVIATFAIAPGAAGDAALAAVRDRTRDGFSVGVTITDYAYDGDTLVVSACDVRETSLVTIPALPSARVTTVAAAPSAPARPSAPIQAAAPSAPAPMLLQAAQVIPRAAAPGLVQMCTAFADGYRRQESVESLIAAFNATAAGGLTDIIPANDAGQSGITRPQWVDQLWQASRAVRPFMSATTIKPVTGLKVQGWKIDLDNLPTIDPYDGNKTAIPTSTFKTLPHTADVVRRAGGWDFDRAFVDLGDGSFIQETLTLALDDYKRKSEAYTVEQLLGSATGVKAGSTFAATLAGLGVAAVRLGAHLDVISMSDDVWLAFAELKEGDVPWWLRSQGQLDLGTTTGTAGKMSFACDPELPTGTILAADSRAYTVHEKSPIQVQALNVANGGIDLGVFAYLSAYVNDPRAVLKITSTPAGK